MNGSRRESSNSSAWYSSTHLPGAALDAAVELAASIGTNAPLALAASKRLVRAAAGWVDADLLRVQDETGAAVPASADAAEGARALTEKRPPVWQGR